jgi:hypothetical protein
VTRGHGGHGGGGLLRGAAGRLSQRVHLRRQLAVSVAAAHHRRARRAEPSALSAVVSVAVSAVGARSVAVSGQRVDKVCIRRGTRRKAVGVLARRQTKGQASRAAAHLGIATPERQNNHGRA